MLWTLEVFMGPIVAAVFQIENESLKCGIGTIKGRGATESFHYTHLRRK